MEMDVSLNEQLINAIERRVKFLLDKGADVHATDQNGYTVLYKAVRSFSIETVGLLLDKGADVNAKDEYEQTVLHKAVRSFYYPDDIKMVDLLLDEGADIIMIKPGMPYLDIIKVAANNFNIPIFAYQVSGEYAMLKAASQNGWLDYTEVIYESMISFKRAGAKSIFTYAALEIAELLGRYQH